MKEMKAVVYRIRFFLAFGYLDKYKMIMKACK